jgi:type III pantothenate kinase
VKSVSGVRDWLLELGHSRLKVARAGGEAGLGEVRRLRIDDVPDWLRRLSPGAGDRFWLAAVPSGDATERVEELLRARAQTVRRVITGSPSLAVVPAYAGLGVDRWLALQSAWRRVGSACCVVDAGTATTIDVIDDYGRHRGGWILPGRAASRAALLARAPVLRRDPGTVESLAPARDTADALERGLLLQQVGAVERALAEARPALGAEPPALLLTGGAAGSLESWLTGAKVEPDLVLEGLAMAVARSEKA